MDRQNRRAEKMRVLIAVACMAMLAGCGANKEWIAMGGSRADGTVKLSLEYTVFETPQIDVEQGVSIATQRCEEWGYTGGAEPFGGVDRKCEEVNGHGDCIAWLVTAEYQCTGKPNQ
jgi:hypothetical protein